MHRAFLSRLEALPCDLLFNLIERKLAEKGVTLKKRQRATLRSELERQDRPHLKSLPGHNSTHQHVVLRLTDADLSELEEKLNHALSTVTIPSLTDELAQGIGRELDRKWKAEQKRQHREYGRFSKRLNRRWGEPLSQLEQLIVVSAELGDSVNRRLRQEHPRANPFTVEVQTRLHARACQIAREVLSLLSAGFAEGAMARWRALHEVTVVSLFITHDEDLAERYRCHEAVESLKAAHQYREHTDRLGLEPLTDSELKGLEANVAALRRRFGQAYSKSYGWAAEKLQKARKPVNFEQIEEAAQLGHFRPYYRLASHSVHANPKGVFFRLGLIDQTTVLLAGPSSFGLADPGQNTAISLGQVTTAVGTLNPTLDDLVVMKVVLKRVDSIRKAFVRVQRDLDLQESKQCGGDA